MKFLSMVLLIAVCGCSTQPLPLNQYVAVKNENLFKFGTGDEFNVVIARDAGLLGSISRIMFFIDGERAGLFMAGEKANFKIPDGNHIFGVGFYNSSAAPPASIDSETEVSISKNTGFYRIFIESNVGIPKISKSSQIK